MVDDIFQFCIHQFCPVQFVHSVLWLSSEVSVNVDYNWHKFIGKPLNHLSKVAVFNLLTLFLLLLRWQYTYNSLFHKVVDSNNCHQPVYYVKRLKNKSVECVNKLLFSLYLDRYWIFYLSYTSRQEGYKPSRFLEI